MRFLLFLVMLTACAATPQDLSGKMLIFPEQTKTANVRLATSMAGLSAATVCLRSYTDLRRNHVLFSLSTPSSSNALLIFKTTINDGIEVNIQGKPINFGGQDYKLNMWHTICSTWDSASGLVQLWFNGNPSIKKFSGGSKITNPIVILGQEQDTYGGGFDAKQSFMGMISDVHMWDYILSSCEIKRYVDDLNFTPGNVLNWAALEFNTTGRVLIEKNDVTCH